MKLENSLKAFDLLLKMLGIIAALLALNFLREKPQIETTGWTSWSTDYSIVEAHYAKVGETPPEWVAHKFRLLNRDAIKQLFDVFAAAGIQEGLGSNDTADSTSSDLPWLLFSKLPPEESSPEELKLAAEAFVEATSLELVVRVRNTGRVEATGITVNSSAELHAVSGHLEFDLAPGGSEDVQFSSGPGTLSASLPANDILYKLTPPTPRAESLYRVAFDRQGVVNAKVVIGGVVVVVLLWLVLVVLEANRIPDTKA